MDPAVVSNLITFYVFPLVRGVALAVGILVFGWIASKWTNRLLRRVFRAKGLDVALAGFLAAFCQYSVIAAAVIAALGAVGIQTTSLVAVFASAGFAVGLALQGSLESFASGVMILLFRPFDIDHKITAAGQTGTVKEIGLFSTTLLTSDNETILIPNKEIAKTSIVNFSAQGTLRGSIFVSLAWPSDAAKANVALLGAAKRTSLVLADPGPEVFVVSVARTLDLTLTIWARSGDLTQALHQVRTAVHEELLAAGVEIAPGAVLVQAPR